MRSLLLSIALLFCTLSTAIAAPREASLGGMRYLVFETGGADTNARLPMIIGLHYSSARPEVMLEYFDNLDFPARVVLPQGRHPRRGGYSWLPANYANLGPAEQDTAAFEAEKELVMFVTSALERHPSRDKPVVMGISYGGDMSFLLAVRHPESIGASFPIAARFLPTWIPSTNVCELNCPPVRAMHGDADTTVPMGPTKESVAKLKKLGYDVDFTPYDGVQHDFDARMERDFVEQTRRLLAPLGVPCSGRAGSDPPSGTSQER